MARGYKIYVICETSDSAKKLQKLLVENDIFFNIEPYEYTHALSKKKK